MARKIKTEPKDKIDVLVEASAKTNQLLEGLVNALQGLTKQPAEATTEEQPTPKKRGRPSKKIDIKPEAPKVNKLNGKPWIDFATLPEAKREKRDVKIDKKLWGNNEPTPRRQASSRINMNCDSCGKPVSVLPEEIGNESTYKCNKCIVKGQGNR